MSTEKADDIVQKEILQAALRLYRKFGPDKVTMDEVAIATGRSRTSLYYYYKNRYELFRAVLDTIVSDVAKEIRSHVANETSVNDKIFAFCQAKIKTSSDWKAVFNAMWASMNSEEKSKQIKAVSVLHKKLVHQEGIIIKEILAYAISKKQVRAISSGDQDMLAFMISSSIRGLRNEIFDQGDPHDINAALQMLTSILTKWLEN